MEKFIHTPFGDDDKRFTKIYACSTSIRVCFSSGMIISLSHRVTSNDSALSRHRGAQAIHPRFFILLACLSHTVCIMRGLALANTPRRGCHKCKSSSLATARCTQSSQVSLILPSLALSPDKNEQSLLFAESARRANADAASMQETGVHGLASSYLLAFWIEVLEMTPL